MTLENIKYAQYRTDELNPRYANNILITSIPDVPSTQEAYRQLSMKPKNRPAGFREFALHHRFEYLADLDEVFLPEQCHIDAVQTIMATVRYCYSHRDPQDPRVMRVIHSWTQRRGTLLANRSCPAQGITLLGPTGTGKTTLLRRIEQMFLPMELQYHVELGGLPCLWPNLPLIWTQCAAQGTLKATLQSVLSIIDAIAQTQFGLQPRAMASRSGAHDTVKVACSVLMAGLLALDDVQNPAAGTNESNILRNHLCGLMDALAMPLLIVANYRARGFLEAEIQHQSKLSSAGTPKIPLMDYGLEFLALAETYWKLNIFSSSLPMPESFPLLLFAHTQGVRRFSVRLAKAVLKEAALDESVLGDKARFESLFNRVALQTLAPYLKALEVLSRFRRANRNLTMEELMRYDELLPDDAAEDFIRRRDEYESSRKSDQPVSPQKSTKRSRSAAKAPKSPATPPKSQMKKGDGKLIEQLASEGLVLHSLDAIDESK